LIFLLKSNKTDVLKKVNVRGPVPLKYMIHACDENKH